MKDYCSLWPDGNYGSCCKTHDEDYEKGGTWKHRMAADAKLRDCVKEKQGFWMAWTMWTGVRLAGWTPKRWNRVSRSWNGGKKGKLE